MEIKLTEPQFNYSELSTQQRELAVNSAIEIKHRHQLIWDNIIAIGQRLLEVKQSLGHGQFLLWIEKEFQWSDRYARNFMTISTELNQIGQAQGTAPTSISGLSMKALTQLAYSLKDTESDDEKTALLEKIDLETESKGDILTEAEIRKIRLEIEDTYRKKQQKLDLQLTDLTYKVQSFEKENNELKKFKQLYEETYQEKRTLDQEKSELDSKLEQIKSQIVKEKENAVKDYVSNFSQDLESKKQKLEKDSQRLQAEITARETNLLSIKSQLDYAKNYQKRHSILTKLLSDFQDFTGKLTENQKDLIPTPAPEMVSEYQALICQLRLWVSILEKAIAPFTQSQTINITNFDIIKEGCLVTTDLVGTIYEVIDIKEDKVSVQTLEHPTESLIGQRFTFPISELILI